MVAMVWAICSSTSTSGRRDETSEMSPRHVRRRARRSGVDAGGVIDVVAVTEVGGQSEAS